MSASTISLKECLFTSQLGSEFYKFPEVISHTLAIH